MIFHHPRPVPEAASSGSGVRPRRMLNAFRGLGYEVLEITGYSSDRARASRRVLEDIARGRRVAFAYAESATTPHALSDPRHYPQRPLLDARLFRALRRLDVPVGLFYRDVHWRFAEYQREATFSKRVAARAFYRFDLITYARTLDVLFVPSTAMVRQLPVNLGDVRIEALPPGAPEPTSSEPTRRSRDLLHLVYVGGVVPPLYDLSCAVEAVKQVEGVHLTICCRDFEVTGLPPLPANCSVVHEQGDRVSALYDDSDVALLVYGAHPYRDFAVPVKLFEAAGHGVPTIASAGTAAGDLVVGHRLGLTVRDAEELASVLRSMVDQPSQLNALRAAVHASVPDHTWAARARQVAWSLIR